MPAALQSDPLGLTFFRKHSNTKQAKTSSNINFRPNSLKIEKKNVQNDPWQKMKQLKAQAKETQQQYLSMLANVKQSQKSISQNYKQIQRRKVSFLKLYETKKLKNLSNNLQKKCKTQRQQNHTQIKQQVKRQKVQQQLSRLITKQEKQAYINKLRQQLQLQKDVKISFSKQKFKDKKYLKQKELFNISRNSFLSIKKAYDQSVERRNQIKSATNVRAKHCYWKRMSQEICMLEEYEKIIKELEEYEQFQSERERGAVQTSQTARTSRTGFFITEKK